MCHSDSSCLSPKPAPLQVSDRLGSSPEFIYARRRELCRFTPTKQRWSAQETGGEEATSPGPSRRTKWYARQDRGTDKAEDNLGNKLPTTAADGISRRHAGHLLPKLEEC